MRRSERLQHNTPEVGGVEPLPSNWLDSVWVKEERGHPMRVWYIKRGDSQAYYAVDGSRTNATREELSALEVPLAYVK